MTLQRFRAPAGAESGFQAAPGTGPVEELDGFPVMDWHEQHRVQPVLAEARRLKAGGEPSPEPVPGGRRIKLPIRVTGRPGE